MKITRDHRRGLVTLEFAAVADLNVTEKGSPDEGYVTDVSVTVLAEDLAEPSPPRFTTAGRIAALEAARKHVDALATNSRGYQDGVKLADKVAAVERTARFILGEEDSE